MANAPLNQSDCWLQRPLLAHSRMTRARRPPGAKGTVWHFDNKYQQWVSVT
jgi:hypothetical protein